MDVRTDGEQFHLEKPNKYSPKKDESPCRHHSGKLHETRQLTSLDYELLATTYGLQKFEAKAHLARNP